VYIATIHPTHYGIARDALNAGKHVLIEKPMTMNGLQASSLISLAREKNLFLMEAMWTAFLPVTRAVLELVRSQKLGQIRSVEGSFSISVSEEEAERLYNPALGGGALLDLGIYPLSYAQMIMGSGYSGFSSKMKFTSKGVDESTEVKLSYPSGSVAELSCHMVHQTPIQFQIHGESGSIHVPHFLGAESFTVGWANGRSETYSFPFRGEGFVEQIEEASQSILKGHLESPIWCHQDSLSVLSLMDSIRQANSLYYPGLESI
jgi:predicted dehydrogenase